MLTGEIRGQIDAVWNAFWSGGIFNPLEVIEQITYLLFLKRLDDLHTLEEIVPDGVLFGSSKARKELREFHRHGPRHSGRRRHRGGRRRRPRLPDPDRVIARSPD